MLQTDLFIKQTASAQCSNHHMTMGRRALVKQLKYKLESGEKIEDNEELFTQIIFLNTFGICQCSFCKID